MAFGAGRVNADISDLFFNTIHDGAVEHEPLREEAKIFLASLERLGVTPLPSIDDLTADFYGRV